MKIQCVDWITKFVQSDDFAEPEAVHPILKLHNRVISLISFAKSDFQNQIFFLSHRLF